MKTQTLKVDGTELTLITALVQDEEVVFIKQQLDTMEASSAGDPDDWQPPSRHAAVEKYPDAWDAPYWQKDNPGDLVRMKWLRTVLTEPLTIGFAHMASMSESEDIDGGEMSELCGFTTAGGWGSALSSAAVHTRRAGRRAIWEARRVNGIWRYWMRDDVRALWRMTDS